MSQRTQEFGIRLALGASTSGLRRDVVQRRQETRRQLVTTMGGVHRPALGCTVVARESVEIREKRGCFTTRRCKSIRATDSSFIKMSVVVRSKAFERLSRNASVLASAPTPSRRGTGKTNILRHRRNMLTMLLRRNSLQCRCRLLGDQTIPYLIRVPS